MNKKKNMLSTFFRSAAHATDSTFTGWRANNAATMKLGQVNPVALSNSRNNKIAFTACNRTFT